jgi:hypothetical protein
MSKLSRAEGFSEPSSADEDRLKTAVVEIERISAEIKFEAAIIAIDRVAEDLRKQSMVNL